MWKWGESGPGGSEQGQSEQFLARGAGGRSPGTTGEQPVLAADHERTNGLLRLPSTELGGTWSLRRSREARSLGKVGRVVGENDRGAGWAPCVTMGHVHREGDQNRYAFFALSWKSCCRSRAVIPRTNHWSASNHCSYSAASRTIGQSPPYTTRSAPKQSITVSK
jgi:hypothetical protein